MNIQKNINNENENEIHIVMCSWKRLFNLKKIVGSLNIQTLKKQIHFHILNNNIDNKTELDNCISNFCVPFKIELTHYDNTHFCFERYFYIRDVIIEKYNAQFVIIIDDDQYFNSKWVENIYSIKEFKTLKTWHCRKYESNYNYVINLDNKDFSFNYGVPGGCIIDTSIFKKNSKFWDIPTNLPNELNIHLFDDYWLSYVIYHIYKNDGWNIIKHNFKPNTIDNPNSLIVSLCNTLFNKKREIFMYLKYDMGWFEPINKIQHDTNIKRFLIYIHGDLNINHCGYTIWLTNLCNSLTKQGYIVDILTINCITNNIIKRNIIDANNVFFIYNEIPITYIDSNYEKYDTIIIRNHYILNKIGMKSWLHKTCIYGLDIDVSRIKSLNNNFKELWTQSDKLKTLFIDNGVQENKIIITEPIAWKYDFEIPERNDNEIRLIYCGTLRDEENILEIIEEFQKIHKERPEVLLKIVYGKIIGNKEFVKKINQYIKNGVEGCEFKYNLSHRNSCYEIATSDIGICWRKNGWGDNGEVSTKVKEYEMYGLYIVINISELNFLHINSLLIKKHLITIQNDKHIFKDTIKLLNSSIYLYKQNFFDVFDVQQKIKLIHLKNKNVSFHKYIHFKNTLTTEKTGRCDKSHYEVNIVANNEFNIQNKPLYISFEHISFEHILFKDVTNVHFFDWKGMYNLNEIDFKNSYIIFYNLDFNNENEIKVNNIFSKYNIIYYIIYNNIFYRENINNILLILNKRIGNNYNIFLNNKPFFLNDFNNKFNVYNETEKINCCLASYPKRFDLLQTTLNTLEKNDFDNINLFMNSYTFKQCKIISNKFKINNILLDNIGSIRAAGKFFWCNQIDNYFFICDDDINYPNDYKKIGMENINNDNTSLYSCLGVRFKPIITLFPLKNERVFNSKFTDELKNNVKVHLIGTGVSFFKANANNFPNFNYLLSYVVYNDDLMAIWCNKNNISQYTIKRTNNWLTSNINMEIGLYEEKAIDPDKQQILKIYQELNWE
jgi:glutaredoxin-related protein